MNACNGNSEVDAPGSKCNVADNIPEITSGLLGLLGRISVSKLQ
jgi:hypothetical protein